MAFTGAQRAGLWPPGSENGAVNTAARTPRRLKQDTSGPYLGSESCKCSENIWILNQPRQRQDGKTNGQKSAGRMGVWGFISVFPGGKRPF